MNEAIYTLIVGLMLGIPIGWALHKIERPALNADDGGGHG